MIVCICKKVSDHTILQHASAGKSFGDIQSELKVATQCGSCEGCARELVARAGCCAHENAAPVLQAA